VVQLTLMLFARKHFFVIVASVENQQRLAEPQLSMRAEDYVRVCTPKTSIYSFDFLLFSIVFKAFLCLFQIHNESVQVTVFAKSGFMDSAPCQPDDDDVGHVFVVGKPDFRQIALPMSATNQEPIVDVERKCARFETRWSHGLDARDAGDFACAGAALPRLPSICTLSSSGRNESEQVCIVQQLCKPFPSFVSF
jgi:hypothetical protein